MKLLTNPIYIVDTETTGLEGFPSDLILELSIYKINTDLSVESIYSTMIRNPLKFKEKIDNCYWSIKLSNIKYDDLKEGKTFNKTWSEIKEILDHKNVISWNMAYDFGKFFDVINHYVKHPSFDAKKLFFKKYPHLRVRYTIKYRKLSCPMEIATDILKIENYYGYKWPTLNEASNHYDVNLDPSGYGFHRADYDTHVTALVVTEMIKRGDYKP